MNARSKEVFQISGDHNEVGRTHGISGPDFTNSTLCKPVVLWRDRLLTLDVYALPGQPMYVILYCPLCQMRDPDNKRNMSLRIMEDNKKIDLDVNRIPKFPGISTEELVAQLGLKSKDELKGTISIEPFGCTWEESADQNKGGSMIAGGLITSCCNWRVVIENNIARDV